ncbi:MAG: hypothetical protein Q8N59_03560 [bacterium]|nr:hypothetical protein [bacterium]
MRKYFGLAKKFPFQMSFITLGVVLAFFGAFLVYIEKNLFIETPSLAEVFILFGIIIVLCAAKNMDKCQMRQLRSYAVRYREYQYQKTEMWPGLN